ncbi:MAG: RsmD family RNA methyltransferase [Pyrinomonadaceae bacterium]
MENRRSQPSQGYARRRQNDDRPSRPSSGRYGGGPKRAPVDGNRANSDQRSAKAGRPGERPQRDYSKFPPRKNADRPALQKWTNKDQKRIKITSDKQITNGRYLGQSIETSPSPKMKITPRRLREIMFKVLSRRVRAVRFLDLCSGSGIVGFEALSRGAMLGTFVDRSTRAVSLIGRNMEVLGVKTGHGEVIEAEAIPFLKNVGKKHRVWDMVYLGPPFGAEYDEILGYFGRGCAMNKGGVLLVEHPSELFLPEKIGVMKRFRVVLNAESAISFFERK